MNNIETLHKQFYEYGSNAKEWLRKCTMLLPEIEKYEVWKAKGFSSIYEYAAKLSGMNRRQVDDALRILRKIADKPALIKVAGQKGINSVRPVATIATEETDYFWAKKAAQLSKNELIVYVRSARQCEKPKNITINMELEAEIASKLQKFYQGNWNELMQKFIDLYEANLKSELKSDKPKKKENTGRCIPKNIKNHIKKRSHGKCEVPNCGKTYTNLHHIDRFGSKREHDPDRIVALCDAHHKLAHRGLIHESDDFSEFKIKKYPDYTNINRYIDDQVQFYRRP